MHLLRSDLAPPSHAGDLLKNLPALTVSCRRLRDQCVIEQHLQRCDGPLRTATDPPAVLALTDPAAPDPEGEGASTNPLRHPGAEGQSLRLRALPCLKWRQRGGDASKEASQRAPETPRRGRRARAHRRDPLGAEETSLLMEELEHATGIRRQASAARETPSENSGHA
ncbi:hypothetical protein NDU88_001744 [Pleurodeles waltl]|uniref:Uncharacterized protein n=1 Tax=Pleurodeles waltl TaxID=8319 RepID=A0AAV7TIP7_PLEWA|nr:hypothetical protein NDU88_001744 [Pleurodeles waltl]